MALHQLDLLRNECSTPSYMDICLIYVFLGLPIGLYFATLSYYQICFVIFYFFYFFYYYYSALNVVKFKVSIVLLSLALGSQ